jgi:chromate reductase
MTSALRVTGISGSLRAASFSSMVLNAVSHWLPAGTAYSTLDIGALPHYNQDLEPQDLPDAVVAARRQISESDAVLIVTPEFNHGIPGVLKNTLDWLSRPAFASCIKNKPVLFMTLSPGALGGVRAQAQLRETLSSMQCRLIPLPEIAITFVQHKLDNGKLVDAPTVAFIQQTLESFLSLAA